MIMMCFDPNGLTKVTTYAMRVLVGPKIEKHMGVLGETLCSPPPTHVATIQWFSSGSHHDDSGPSDWLKIRCPLWKGYGGPREVGSDLTTQLTHQFL